jgi:Domain of unknown function (DUF4268)
MSREEPTTRTSAQQSEPGGFPQVPPALDPGQAFSTEATSIGKIERVALRDVWKHEAHNLTVWLEENIDVLNDVLDFNLTSVERERAAGAFSVDLLGEDDAGRTVVIENQLERSNHDHLGKLVTYVALTEARAAVWVVSDPRPEHVRAISWLNESSPADFYLLKIEGIRISGSVPAPLLTLIVGPSEESREVGDVKKERAERHQLFRRFWTELLERARERTRLYSGVSAGDYHWIGTSPGKRGLGLNLSVTQHAGVAELYIDRGRGADEENFLIFDSLHSARDEIEQVFGGPLEWLRLDSKRACRILTRIEIGGYRDEESWPEVQDAMIDSMIRLERALKPHIAKLAI